MWWYHTCTGMLRMLEATASTIQQANMVWKGSAHGRVQQPGGPEVWRPGLHRVHHDAAAAGDCTRHTSEGLCITVAHAQTPSPNQTLPKLWGQPTVQWGPWGAPEGAAAF